MKIQNTKELEDWLSDNNFLEDGHVLKIETSPLRIEIGYNIAGNCEANSERAIQTFYVTA